MSTEKKLIAKLCGVMGDLSRVAKTGHNDFQNYDYVTEADVLEAVRKHLFERNIWLHPNIKNHRREPKASGKGYFTDIDVEWTFHDGETGEELTISVPGCAEDSGDKGLWKAITGSSKYLLLKSFLLPTGDDPEKDHPGQDRESEAAPTLPEPSLSARPYKLQPPTPKPQQPQTGSLAEGQLMKVEARAWTSKKTGKGGTVWDATINLEDGNLVASTFDRQLADEAKQSVGQLVRARISPGVKQGYWTLEGFEEVQIDDWLLNR